MLSSLSIKHNIETLSTIEQKDVDIEAWLHHTKKSLKPATWPTLIVKWQRWVRYFLSLTIDVLFIYQNIVLDNKHFIEASLMEDCTFYKYKIDKHIYNFYNDDNTKTTTNKYSLLWLLYNIIIIFNLYKFAYYITFSCKPWNHVFIEGYKMQKVP